MNSKTSIKVIFFGFNEKDTAKFLKIFQLIRPNKIPYCVGNNFDAKNVDIAIVNTNSSLANEQYNLFRSKCPAAALVTFGPNRSPYHISGMLLASRVYNVLDKVPLAPIYPEKHESPVATKDNIQSRLQQAATPLDTPKVAEPEVATSRTVVAPETASPKVSPQVTQEPAYQVLVVDDSELMQKALQVELEKVDCVLNIDFASSGEEGVQRIDEKKYDLIFMDVMMPQPGMDGFEACAAIRKKPEMKKTPIIMLTAKTSPLDEVKGVISGCSTYLTKPLEKDNFQEVMKRVLEWLEKYRMQ